MTYEQILKAIDDLSDEDKKKLHQSLKDRIDESVAAQEREDGTEDSQTAKDRVDESLGEEEHEAEKREEEDEGTDAKASEASEEAEETEEKLEEHEAEDESKKDDMSARISGIEATVAKLVEMLTKGSDKESAAEKKAQETYGIGNGAFVPDADESKSGEKVDVRKVLRNLGF